MAEPAGRTGTIAVPGWLIALREFVAEASPLRRAMLAFLATLPFLALAAAWFWFNPVDYRALYPTLSDRAGGEVLAALDQLDVPYRLSADGSIEVPSDRVHAARYRLAAQGLPRSDEAARAEADEAPRFGASSQQEQQRAQRALEADLARSIQTLDAVDLARVHLALPRVSPFLRDAPSATAAVLVRLKPGAALSTEQAATIRALVAASVPRMRRSEVQVLDPGGVLLGGESAEAEGPSRRTALEQDLVRRVQSVLGPWLGEERVNVQVTATLDDGETRQTVERVRNVVVAGQARPLEKTVRTTHLPEGRLARIDAIVILGFEADRTVRTRVGQLARQALGMVPARGDTLNVYVLPERAVPGPEAVSAPAAVPPPASIPAVRAPAPTGRADTDTPAWLPLFGLAGAAAAAAVLALTIRRRRLPEEQSGDVPDDFETLLDAARRQTLDDPRITADVIKLWMRA